MNIRLAILAAAAGIPLCAASAPALAQTVRGRVVEAGTDVPVVGAFVILEDTAGRRRSAVLAHADGTYIVVAPSAGAYRLRVERIGHATTLSPLIELAAGQTLVYQVEAPQLPVSLPALTVAGEERCRQSRDAGADVQTVWEEARKALAITDWLESSGRLAYQMSLYERSRHLNTQRIIDGLPHARRVRSGTGKTPFYSESAEALADGGYIRALPDGGYRYYGLDAQTLLSDGFLDTHCFRVARPQAGGERRLGLQFEPLPGQQRPDVTGVLWLDPETFELTRLEYVYTRHPQRGTMPQGPFGGTADFRRLPNGAWIVSSWRIRMPHSILSPEPGLAVREEGGEVTFVAVPPTASGAGVISGVVYDSTRNRPLAGATVFLTTANVAAGADAAGRFRLGGVPEGEHEIGFFHSYTDSLALPLRPMRVIASRAPARIELTVPASAACAARGDEPATVSIIGFVDDVGTAAVVGGREVTARWRVRRQWRWYDALRGIGPYENVTARTMADDDGRFLICGVPADHTVQLRAGSGPAVRIETGSAAVLRQDLVAR